MITSKNDWPRYKYTCDACEGQISFMSNKPPCDTIEVICDCYQVHTLQIPDTPGKYRYRTQPKTELIRHEILHTFADIPMRMTVRQVYYQLVIKGVVDKTEAGYSQVQTQLLRMRQEGMVPLVKVLS